MPACVASQASPIQSYRNAEYSIYKSLNKCFQAVFSISKTVCQKHWIKESMPPQSKPTPPTPPPAPPAGRLKAQAHYYCHTGSGEAWHSLVHLIELDIPACLGIVWWHENPAAFFHDKNERPRQHLSADLSVPNGAWNCRAGGKVAQREKTHRSIFSQPEEVPTKECWEQRVRPLYPFRAL